jgi:membrane-associated phospholipid phosphatase
MTVRGNHIDPTVAAASESTWRRWLTTIVSLQRGRLASFGVIVLLGFLAGVAALYAFIYLADGVLELQTASLDTSLATWVHQFDSPALDVAARVVSTLGSEIVSVLAGVLLVVFIGQRRWGAAALLVVVTAGAQLLNDGLKGVFHRTRPAPLTGLIDVQQYSFPSGHAMVGMAFYFYLAYLTWRLARGWRRWAIVTVLTVLVVAIGLSRIYLNAHYASDVLAGYLAGFLWADAVIIGGLLLRPRHTVRH